jgi:hypothetical protein
MPIIQPLFPLYAYIDTHHLAVDILRSAILSLAAVPSSIHSHPVRRVSVLTPIRRYSSMNDQNATKNIKHSLPSTANTPV